MAHTAVGLFEHPGVADAAVDALRANGIPSSRIRVLAEPAGSSVDDPMSTPSVDFAASLTRDLRSIGATESECKAYVEGVQNGNVVLFVNGTRIQAEEAMAIMNEYDPVVIEELAGEVPVMAGLRVGEAGHHSQTVKSERAQSEGVRLFSW